MREGGREGGRQGEREGGRGGGREGGREGGSRYRDKESQGLHACAGPARFHEIAVIAEGLRHPRQPVRFCLARHAPPSLPPGSPRLLFSLSLGLTPQTLVVSPLCLSASRARRRCRSVCLPVGVPVCRHPTRTRAPRPPFPQ